MIYMVDQINTGQIVQKPEVIIEPIFPAPFGVTGVSQKEGELVDVQLEDDQYDLDATGTTSSDPDSSAADNVLVAPGYVNVVSSKVRISGGKTFIDLVVEVEDVPGVSNYEVRVTRG